MLLVNIFHLFFCFCCSIFFFSPFVFSSICPIQNIFSYPFLFNTRLMIMMTIRWVGLTWWLEIGGSGYYYNPKLVIKEWMASFFMTFIHWVPAIFVNPPSLKLSLVGIIFHFYSPHTVGWYLFINIFQTKLKTDVISRWFTVTMRFFACFASIFYSHQKSLAKSLPYQAPMPGRQTIFTFTSFFGLCVAKFVRMES